MQQSDGRFQVGAMLDRTQGFEPGHWREALAFAQDAGLDGVLFAHSRTIDADLDADELLSARRAFEEAGMFIETGVGELGPSGDDDERIADLEASLNAAATLGATRVFGFTRTVRDPGLIDHAVQLEQIARRLHALRPVLERNDQVLNVKTHEDLSSSQVLALVEGAGPDRFAVSLDVANLVVRGEDPVAAARRLTPYIRQTHLEDVALFFVDAGLRRRLRPCGQGVFDWPALIEVLRQNPVDTLVIEQHLGRFDADIFEPSWFDAEPHVIAAELAGLIAGAARTEAASRDGSGPTLDDLEPQATIDERRRALRTGATALRAHAAVWKEVAA